MNYWQNKKTGVIISRDSKYVFHPFFWVLIGSDDSDTTTVVDNTDTDADSIVDEILSTASENNEFEDYNDLTKNADKTRTAYIGDASYNYIDSRWRKAENG